MRIVLMTALLTLALPVAASAETFCVHSPADCTGSALPTLQAALDAAAANGAGEDQIRIGAGTFDEPPAVDVLGNPVEIVGAGPGQTTLQSSTAPLGKVVDIREPGSVVSQLHLHYTGSVIASGIELAGDAHDVRVTNADPSVTFTGITLEGTADITDARVDVESAPSLLSRALFVVQGADVDVDDVLLEAPVGINVSGGDAVVDRARIRATQGVSVSFGAGVEVRDSEIRVRDSSASNYSPTAFFAGGDDATFLDVDRVTAYAEGSGSGAKGVWAQPNGGANSATIDLRGSVLHNFQVAISLLEDAGTTVTLTSDWCAYDLSSVGFLNSPTYTPGANMVDLAGVDPQLRDAAGGDLRPLHSSPLVDAGDPAFQPASTVFDVLRSQRLRNGVVDVGAHEYQRFAPQAEASASVSAAAIGATIGFDASASTDLDEEPLTYAWSFDDGTAATGAQAQHAFATPGQHSATVEVTDPSGLSASAEVTVDVTAPAGGTVPPPSSGQPGTGSPGSGDDQPGATARLSGLRLSPARFRSRGARRGKPPLGTTLSYRLSAAARVVFTIERARQGRRVKGACRKPTRANRARRPCTRWVAVGRFGVDGKAGANTIRFAGKVGGKPLPPGSYRIRARTPGSQPAAAKRFRVLRAPTRRP